MKKFLTVILCLCTLSALCIPALAEEDELPPRWLYASDEEWEAAVAAQASVPSGTSNESVGADHGVSASPTSPTPDIGSSGRYPLGSYVDPSGNVYSPSGELLSPDTSITSETPLEAAPPVQVLESPAALTAAAAVPDTPSDIPVWYVEDLRSAESPAVPDGLKALITSIFGEYTPITTTSVISETVGSETHQYLVEAVAPGAAGVDYEWLAGVFLFGIFLFCLMKLLGGVLK